MRKKSLIGKLLQVLVIKDVKSNLIKTENNHRKVNRTVNFNQKTNIKIKESNLPHTI